MTVEKIGLISVDKMFEDKLTDNMMVIENMII